MKDRVELNRIYDNPNTDNVPLPEALIKLTLHISNYGLLDPIKVKYMSQQDADMIGLAKPDGKYIIIDGHSRIMVLRQLSYDINDKVKVVVL